MRLRLILSLIATMTLAGCASPPAVPATATLVAQNARPDDAVTVPAGTRFVYFVQRGPISMNVTRWPIEATTRPTEVPVSALFLGSGSKPIDVYAGDE
jgi:hypothetical protein